jgi:hypothetical protein
VVALLRRISTVVLGLLWLGGVGAGFTVLGQYETKRGEGAAVPSGWPAAATLERALDRPTLLVFVHPRCPCTSATIEELNRLLARSSDRVRAIVAFYSDPSLGDTWVYSPSYASAARIPGVILVEDPLGSSARLFGARTSGQACLYDRSGQLVFTGGITRARGHAGDSDGSRSVLALILGGGNAASAPVFGCSLLGSSEAER